MANFPTRDASRSERDGWSDEDWEKGWREEALPCPRCDGKGIIAGMPLGGVCFKCSGRHMVKGRAYTPEYRAKLDAKSERAQQRKEERLEKQRREGFAASLKAYPRAHEVAAIIADEIDLLGHAGAVDKWGEFVIDVSRKGLNGPLSNKQAMSLIRAYDNREKYIEKIEAEEESAGEAPLGKVTFTGEVLSTKVYDGAYGIVHKMLLKVDDHEGVDGWFKVWTTIPAQLLRAVVDYGHERLKGDVVTLTATLTPGKDPDDKSFVVAKRPSLVMIEEKQDA